MVSVKTKVERGKLVVADGSATVKVVSVSGFQFKLTVSTANVRRSSHVVLQVEGFAYSALNLEVPASMSGTAQLMLANGTDKGKVERFNVNLTGSRKW